MIKSYDLWDDGRGTSKRAIIIVGKDGVIRFRKEYAAGNIPDPKDILEEVEKLG